MINDPAPVNGTEEMVAALKRPHPPVPGSNTSMHRAKKLSQDSINMLILFFQAIFATNMMISSEINKNIDIIFNFIVSSHVPPAEPEA